MLSDALSSALCHVNRFAPAKATAKGTALRPRLLASPPPLPFQCQARTYRAAAAAQIVSCSPDDGAQYRAMMNATFAAQRLAAPIDACCLGVTDSAFLQQAAHITGGTYTFPLGGGSAAARGGVAATPAASGGQRRQLYQHLLSTFLADSDTRKQLVQQKPPSLDLRPACFKTKRVVDVGCAPHPAVTQPLPVVTPATKRLGVHRSQR